jgi:hypothetical protein
MFRAILHGARADYVGRRANGDPLKENDLPFILKNSVNGKQEHLNSRGGKRVSEAL